MKAFFIVQQITHYRESFYEKLIKANPQFDWLIIDSDKKIKDLGRPSLYKKFSFPTKRFIEELKTMGPFTIRNYPGLAQYVKKENPDLVVMPTIVGTNTYREIARWCKANQKKLILWSCLWEHEAVNKSPLKSLKKIAFKRFVNMASDHITYSSFASKKLMKNGVNPNSIQIAFNGIDIDNLEELRLTEGVISKKKEELNISGNKTLLYVGAINKDKKVDLLLNAFSSFNKKNPHNNLKLLIIGDGTEKQALEVLAKDLGISDAIKFLGRIVNNVESYFQICDCLVLPGAGGLALNQALYWEKPCIVSHADGTEEDLITEGVTGFRFESLSAESLEQAINRFHHADKDTLKEMGAKGKKIIEDKSNVNKMIDVFTTVINNMNLK